jgi:hypothetical protein
MKQENVQIPAQALDEAFRAMTRVSSILHAATYHGHDIELIRKSVGEMGGLDAFDKKAGVLFEHLPKEYQTRLMER